MSRIATFVEEPRRVHVNLSRLDVARLNLLRRHLAKRGAGAPFATVALRYALAVAERELLRATGGFRQPPAPPRAR